MAGRRRRRAGLSAEDAALWRAATRDATPLAPELRDPPAPTPPETSGAGSPASARPGPAAPPPPDPPPRRPWGDGAPAAPASFTLDLAPPPPGRIGRAPGLDRRTARRLGRGAREPEARIDLHGMTAERAHRALDACIAGALGRGLRLVLVITGKGGRGGADGMPSGPLPGRLRREAPRWLRAGPHAARIVGIFEAHPRHGGSGAFYVYLKRLR